MSTYGVFENGSNFYHYLASKQVDGRNALYLYWGFDADAYGHGDHYHGDPHDYGPRGRWRSRSGLKSPNRATSCSEPAGLPEKPAGFVF